MAGTQYTRIRYSFHARDQIHLRLVSEEQVERTIANPSRRYPSVNPPDRIVVERLTAVGNTLCVVFVEVPVADGREALVVTVIRIGGRRR